ncbi:MAG: hypothetical protein AB1522_16555 [Chloroflexota bacterium]
MASNVLRFCMLGMFAAAVATSAEADGLRGNPTKTYLLECATTGFPSRGLLGGDELINIQSKTKSLEPVFVRVERIQDVIGATERDPTCGRYRVSYSQAGVKDVSGNIAPKPFTFGYDINICGDGRPAIARD